MFATNRGPFKSEFPITDSSITSAYPELYKAITRRDAQALLPFLSSKSAVVRNQSWRALANTPVDSLSMFIALAENQNTDASWFAISQHKCSGDQLRALEQAWSQHPDYRTGINRVLGQQGDKHSLEFLMDRLTNENHGEEPQFALAIGRLVRRNDINEEDQLKIIQRAFGGLDEQYTRGYLYGWYRGAQSPLTSAAKDTLFNRWRVFGVGTNTQVDQYINKLLPVRTTYRMVVYYNGEQQLEKDIQLSVELASSLGKVTMNENNSLAARILLSSSNSIVQERALQSLSHKINRHDDLFDYISTAMVEDNGLSDAVWLQAVQTAVKVDSDLIDDHWERIDGISQKNPYLLPRALAIYEEAKPVDGYLSYLKNIIAGHNSLTTMFALQSLSHYWQSMPEDQKTKSRISQVRELVFSALDLHDRGAAYMAKPLLEDEIFHDSDFNRINRALSTFKLPGDIEAYQVFGSLYKSRFEEQAKPVIDSLAALNYAPLNRSLANAGWDVNVPEESHTNFRMPNWARLWELGRHPVWELKTNRGSIVIRLNTLSAPATVSVIDSLSRVGAYDNIPFHRVVPNFVIQGGDIERKDGFGGPDFVIPTEASEEDFVRGAVGIASAGTDTEGSQYFIMHQWKPHLNGHYTRFGEVIDGMDVVDRIQVGDEVLSTQWY
jgi:cyclophilin family peptidyl-prolyl cis-trans isomerase